MKNPPPQLRHTIALANAVLGPLLFVVLGAPSWIPNIRNLMLGLAAPLEAAGLAAVVYVVARDIRNRGQSAWILARLLASRALLVAWVLGLAWFGVMLHLEMFPATLLHELKGAGHATLYVYDASLFEPEIEVRVRHSWLPIETSVLRRVGCSPDRVQLEPDRLTVRVCDRRCDLVSLRCE